MLAGKRVHKEIMLAMVTAVLLLAATSQTARAYTPTCTASYTSTLGTTDTGCYGVQFINYFSNATPANPAVFDRIIDPMEASSGASGQPEEICAMIYVFDELEALQECCGCPVTADGLLTLSVGGGVPSQDNLTNDPLSVAGQFWYTTLGFSNLQDGVIRVVSATTNASTTPYTGGFSPALERYYAGTAEHYAGPAYCDRLSGKCCDPSGLAPNGTGSGTITLTTTLRAWADHIQNGPGVVTNTAFEENPLSNADATNLAELCAQTVTTGQGICNCGNEFPPFGTDSGGNQGTGGN